MAAIINKFIQFGIVTPDTDKTVSVLFEKLNLGPFKVLGFVYPAIFDTTINNIPQPWTVKVAVGWIGNIPLEVIQPTGGKTYDEAYLDKFKVAGIQQLVMDKGKRSYKEMKKILADAGTPVLIEAKTNIGFFLGPFAFPPFPPFLARCMATVFGYIPTQDTLKVVIEASKYPLGVSNKSGIDMAVPQYWTKGNKKNFNVLPEDSLITDIQGFVVLVNSIDEVKPHYEKLFGNSSSTLGEELFYQLDGSFLRVVQPRSGTVYGNILNQRGEGARILMASPRQNTRQKCDEVFEQKGFSIANLEDNTTLYIHKDMPFEIQIKLDC